MGWQPAPDLPEVIVGELASRLASLILVLDRATGGIPVDLDHLRFPVGGPRTFTGSDLGALIWATEEGQTLLDLASKDEQVVESFAGNWDAVSESRMILTSAVAAWQTVRTDPRVFAENIESLLWESLRRTETTARAVAIVEGVEAPPGGLSLPYGTAIIQPDDRILEESFAECWPGYRVRLPVPPFALTVARVLVPRRYFGSVAAPSFAYVGLMQLREAIWLTTGAWVRIGHAAVFEENAFPVSVAEHHSPERYGSGRRTEVRLKGQQAELVEMVMRLGVLHGHGDELELERFGLDSTTGITLRTIRSQVDAATHSADAITPLLAAFSLAEGCLTDRDEPGDAVPRRYAVLCGRDDDESRELRRRMKALDPIRDAIAHGARPSNGEMDRFLGNTESLSDEQISAAWFPEGWDQTESAARTQALELLRRLYRAWLRMTIDLAEGSATPRFTREEALALIRDAARGSATTLARIRSIVH